MLVSSNGEEAIKNKSLSLSKYSFNGGHHYSYHLYCHVHFCDCYLPRADGVALESLFVSL